MIATRSATRGFARKRLVVVSATDANLTETAPDDSPDPERRMMNAEQQQRVHVMLEKLPVKQRRVVRLFHLQGKSYAEISAELQMPIGSIGPTLRRAEAKLREWMDDEYRSFVPTKAPLGEGRRCLGFPAASVE